MSHDGSYLPVSELFPTFQGEGLHMGRRAFFIRTYGCDAKCHFCDSAATWHPDWKPAHIQRYDVPALLSIAEHAMPAIGSLVVFTGGEPTLYNLEPVVLAFKAQGWWTCLETAGHHPIPESIDHITLSPKVFTGFPPLPENVARADEFKIIVEDILSLTKALASLGRRHPNAPIWLHPEWSRREDRRVLDVICQAVQADHMMRAGWQVHKLYDVDSLAPGSDKRLVPLGGVRPPPHTVCTMRNGRCDVCGDTE